MKTSLAGLRRQIDAVDRELLALLNRRARLALEAGRRKRAAGQGLRDPGREEQVLAGARTRNGGPLSAAAIERLFRAIVAESCRMQARVSAKAGNGTRRATP
jgi:chorismate mutase/prephenate dehydratase